jgi:hypothetical protein
MRKSKRGILSSQRRVTTKRESIKCVAERSCWNPSA